MEVLRKDFDGFEASHGKTDTKRKKNRKKKQ
jgi:hypothetical protein